MVHVCAKSAQPAATTVREWCKRAGARSGKSGESTRGDSGISVADVDFAGHGSEKEKAR